VKRAELALGESREEMKEVDICRQMPMALRSVLALMAPDLSRPKLTLSLTQALKTKRKLGITPPPLCEGVADPNGRNKKTLPFRRNVSPLNFHWEGYFFGMNQRW